MRLLPAIAAWLLALGPAAWALDADAALRLLLDRSGQASQPACTLVAPWGPDGLSVVVAPDDTGGLRIALMRDGAEGRPEIVAGPSEFEPITIDPPWACVIALATPPALGGRRVIALRMSNSYTSTGRSTSTEALHLLLAEGAALRAVFGSVTAARHSEEVSRNRRTGWQRSYRIAPQPAAAGVMPEIQVRDARSGRLVSRHRWRGDAYHPPQFDRFGPLGPG